MELGWFKTCGIDLGDLKSSMYGGGRARYPTPVNGYNI